MIAHISPKDELLWHAFAQRQRLNEAQLLQFKRYYDLLVRTNDIHNLTAITDLKHVIHDHFEDSLILRNYSDIKSFNCLSDVGTGAGFPAIPLKIMFPHLSLVLIEVSQKRIYFLEVLIEKLGLTNVLISELDWRTFLRKTNFPIDLFCARASLQPDDLVRMFRPSSPYKDARLVYWASQYWIADKTVLPFLERKEQYIIGDKKRQLVFFHKEKN